MKRLFYIIMLVLSAITAQAQDLQLDKVHTLLEQGKYLEAAKELRPLADGGNAEAQQLAAWLFFTGKGVKKNDTQGMKYARMALEQGNFEALRLLASYCRDREDFKESVAIVKNYILTNPEFQKHLNYLDEDEDMGYVINQYLRNMFVGKNNDGMLQTIDSLYAVNPAEGELNVELLILKNEGKLKRTGKDTEDAGKMTEEELCRNFGSEPPMNKYIKAILAMFARDGRCLKYNPVLAMNLAKEAEAEGSAMAKYMIAHKFSGNDLKAIEIHNKELAEQRENEENEVLREYLRSIIQYPDEALKQSIQGRVFVEFDIDRNGSIINEKIVSSADPILGEEVLRVIKGLPKWKPALESEDYSGCTKLLLIVFQILTYDKKRKTYEGKVRIDGISNKY